MMDWNPDAMLWVFVIIRGFIMRLYCDPHQSMGDLCVQISQIARTTAENLVLIMTTDDGNGPATDLGAVDDMAPLSTVLDDNQERIRITVTERGDDLGDTQRFQTSPLLVVDISNDDDLPGPSGTTTTQIASARDKAEREAARRAQNRSAFGFVQPRSQHGSNAQSSAPVGRASSIASTGVHAQSANSSANSQVVAAPDGTGQVVTQSSLPLLAAAPSQSAGANGMGVVSVPAPSSSQPPAATSMVPPAATLTVPPAASMSQLPHSQSAGANGMGVVSVPAPSSSQPPAATSMVPPAATLTVPPAASMSQLPHSQSAGANGMGVVSVPAPSSSQPPAATSMVPPAATLTVPPAASMSQLPHSQSAGANGMGVVSVPAPSSSQPPAATSMVPPAATLTVPPAASMSQLPHSQAVAGANATSQVPAPAAPFTKPQTAKKTIIKQKLQGPRAMSTPKPTEGMSTPKRKAKIVAKRKLSLDPESDKAKRRAGNIKTNYACFGCGRKWTDFQIQKYLDHQASCRKQKIRVMKRGARYSPLPKKRRVQKEPPTIYLSTSSSDSFDKMFDNLSSDLSPTSVPASSRDASTQTAPRPTVKTTGENDTMPAFSIKSAMFRSGPVPKELKWCRGDKGERCANCRQIIDTTEESYFCASCSCYFHQKCVVLMIKADGKQQPACIFCVGRQGYKAFKQV